MAAQRLRKSEQTARPESISPTQNHLLAALTAAELAPLLPHMTLTELPLGTVLYESRSMRRAAATSAALQCTIPHRLEPARSL